jgi:hypothetical protein
VNTAPLKLPEPHALDGRIQSDPPWLHIYLRAEFPIALCGHISPLDKIPDEIPARHQLCRRCKEIADRYQVGDKAVPHQLPGAFRQHVKAAE